MAIKHKHMSETVDDMTTGWRRILIGSGFFCLSVMMLWWWYCAIRATSPQMIDIDVSGNNRYSTILLVVLLVFIVAVSVFAKVRQAVRGIWHMMVRYKWILFVIVICWQIVMFFALGPATGFDAEWVIDYVVNPQVITDKGLDGASYLSNSPNNYLLFFVELGIYKALPFVTSLEALLQKLTFVQSECMQWPSGILMGLSLFGVGEWVGGWWCWSGSLGVWIPRRIHRRPATA